MKVSLLIIPTYLSVRLTSLPSHRPSRSASSLEGEKGDVVCFIAARHQWSMFGEERDLCLRWDRVPVVASDFQSDRSLGERTHCFILLSSPPCPAWGCSVGWRLFTPLELHFLQAAAVMWLLLFLPSTCVGVASKQNAGCARWRPPVQENDNKFIRSTL